jgi:hypothetical protein
VPSSVGAIICPTTLSSVTPAQLSEDMTGGTFDVGYIQGNSAVSIRCNEDLAEIWDQLQKGKNNIVLWCDGLVLDKENRKRSLDSDDDIEIEKRSKKRKMIPLLRTGLKKWCRN